jgi:hypothetical protein
MRLESFRRQLFCSLLVLPFVLTGGSAVCAGQLGANPLARVQKIFIQSFPSATREMQVGPLTRELKKYGFELVEDPSQADGILTGAAQAEITLHGDGSIPDKSIFTYELTLPNKAVIWKHQVKFVSKSALSDDYDYAAKKIAERLFKDRQKSLTKAVAK